jgi:hypothetical protein
MNFTFFKKHRFIDACILIFIFLASTAYAQSVLDLQLELDKANYDLKSSEANRFVLVNTLSLVVEDRCLKTTYPKPSNTPECLSAIEEAKKFEPELPSIVCATNGVDSEACSMIYSDLEVKQFNNEIEGVQDKFASPEALRQIVGSYKESPDPKKLLDTACRYSGIVKNPQRDIGSVGDLQNPFKIGVRGARFTRFLSSDCLSAIKMVGDYKLTPCYRFGFYSPFCANAMKINDNSSSSPKKKETGLASF